MRYCMLVGKCLQMERLSCYLHLIPVRYLLTYPQNPPQIRPNQGAASPEYQV